MSTRKDAKKALKKARKRAEQAADLNPIRTLGDFGVRSNHALGMFGPGYKEAGVRFTSMVKELSADPTALGFLGASNFMSLERDTSNEILSVLYFESLEALHSYAHGPLHTKTMEWWQSSIKQLPHYHDGIAAQMATVC